MRQAFPRVGWLRQRNPRCWIQEEKPGAQALGREFGLPQTQPSVGTPAFAPASSVSSLR